MKKFIEFIKNNFYILGLWGLFFVVLAVNIKINMFRYSNFDYGKFDLGNMNQMIWNTLHGKFMYLTDYFGTNLPRWAMSHVDPILLLFIPLFVLIPHPMTITYAQILLVLGSCFLVYKIAYLELKSKPTASLLGASFLVYPAVGFITAWTGFHGVSVAVPFFFGAFYVFEKMYKENNFSKKGLILFWILLVITMSGKEQLPLYVIFYGIFIMFFRNNALKNIKTPLFEKEWFKSFLKLPITKLSASMILVGTVWFITAFFIIIPRYAHYRIDGFNKFVGSLNIDGADTRSVDLPNYFLARYDAFGDSYTQVVINMLLHPDTAIRIFFGGDRIDNLVKTFGPLSYLSFAYPTILMLAVPDLMINYLTSADGVGTSEVTNHRISMLIPVLFIAAIYGIGFLSSLFSNVVTYLVTKLAKNGGKGKNKKDNVFYKNIFLVLFSILIFGSNVYMTFYSNNPVFLWLEQAMRKKVFAKNIDSGIGLDKLNIGDVVRMSELEEKDRECAQKIVKIIPKSASVSGPDYLGAHLSLRETYAIFPALYNEADYVIVDVFSRKLLSILDVDVDLARDVVESIIKNNEYKLITGCGNLFVFKNIGVHVKPDLMPLQERFIYEEKVNIEFFQSLYIVDYNLPRVITRGSSSDATFVYIKRENNSIGDYVMFTSLVNSSTGEIYQMANLASFSILKPGEWKEDRYYTENVEIAVPEFLDTGVYKLFIGMGNNIHTRSLYLGDVEIR